MTLGHVSVGRVNCVTAHPTQAGIVLSGSSDQTARVWDCASKSLLTKIKFEAGVTAAAYLNIQVSHFNRQKIFDKRFRRIQRAGDENL